MPFWLAALFGFMIVARVTRFVNDDVLASGIRSWANGANTLPEDPSRWRRIRHRAGQRLYRALVWIFGSDEVSILARCPWCLSIWVALPVSLYVVLVPLDGFWGKLLAVGGLWLGFSYVYGLVAGNFDE